MLAAIYVLTSDLILPLRIDMLGISASTFYSEKVLLQRARGTNSYTMDRGSCSNMDHKIKTMLFYLQKKIRIATQKDS